MATEYQYTGQFNQAALGLYFYGARWYDSYLNRWTSPDTIIPDPYNTSDYDRYAYVRNNPIRYTDPTGHMVDDGCNTEGCNRDIRDIAEENYRKERDYNQRCQHGNGRNCPDYSEIATFIVGNLGLASADILAPAAVAQIRALIADLLGTICADSDCTNETQTLKKFLDTIKQNASGTNSDFEKYWSKGTFDTVLDSIQYHFKKHGVQYFTNPSEYTQAAIDFYNNFKSLGVTWTLKTGEIGIKITANGLYGIYTNDGLIVSFGVK